MSSTQLNKCGRQAKQFTGAPYDYKLPTLENTTGTALNSVSAEQIDKFSRTVQEYMKGYRDGHTPGKQYKYYDYDTNKLPYERNYDTNIQLKGTFKIQTRPHTGTT